MEMISLRDKLRNETRLLHSQLEQATGMEKESLSYATYLNYLKKFYSFFLTLEECLQKCEVTTIPDFYGKDRLKLGLIKKDLLELGLNENEIDQIPACDKAEFPRGNDLWGAIYVIEGSTLGGQVLAERLLRSPDILQKKARHFVNSYGARTGERWQETVKRINEIGNENTCNQEVLSGARWTFSSLKNLFEQVPA